MTEQKTGEYMLHCLRHAVGYTRKKAVSSYRNHFVASDGGEDERAWRILVGLGLAAVGRRSELTGDYQSFHVTPAECAFVRATRRVKLEGY